MKSALSLYDQLRSVMELTHKHGYDEAYDFIQKCVTKHNLRNKDLAAKDPTKVCPQCKEPFHKGYCYYMQHDLP